jgi:hypothetical protein
MRKCFRRVLRLSAVTILSRRPGFYAGLADVEVVRCKVAPRQVYHQIPICPFAIIFPSAFHTHLRSAFIRMSKELNAGTFQYKWCCLRNFFFASNSSLTRGSLLTCILEVKCVVVGVANNTVCFIFGSFYYYVDLMCFDGAF